MKVEISYKFKNNDGSTIVLMVLIIAAVIMLGISLLSITVSQYQIRKSNSEIKKAMYLSEEGINISFLNAYSLVISASDNALFMAEEYLIVNPEDIIEAINIFKNNYKVHFIKNVISYINNNGNPQIKVVNTGNLYFINEKLTVKVSSKYISSMGIEKTIDADIIVSIPDFNEARSGNMEFFELLAMVNFDL